MTARRWQLRFCALALGAVFATGQPPFDLWALALSALIGVFFLSLLAKSRRDAAWLGWLFGTAYFAVSMAWLLEPFQVDAAVTGWMAPFALAGMAGGLAAFWALAFRFGHQLGGGLAIALCWALAELARAYVFTGFPWGLVGYVWAETPAVHWLPWIGPHGLTLVTLIGTAAIAIRETS